MIESINLFLFILFCLASNTPSNNCLVNGNLQDSSSGLVKSTNFNGSIVPSRSEVRHKSEIEIEVKHDKPRSNKTPPKTISNNNINTSPSSYPVLVRNHGNGNKRTPTLLYEEQAALQSFPLGKRRPLNNSIATQTPPSPRVNPYDHHLQQQQLKALTDETLSKNEKIQAILRELNDCQVRFLFLSIFYSLLGYTLTPSKC